MTMGILWGFWMWKSMESSGRKKITRTESVLKTVLFFGLMLGLLYLLWKMW